MIYTIATIAALLALFVMDCLSRDNYKYEHEWADKINKEKK